MRVIGYLAVVGLLSSLGCGNVREAASRHRVGFAPVAAEDKAVWDAQEGAQPPGAKAEDKVPAGGKAPAQPMPRKIIYTAEVNLIVKDFEKAEQEFKQLVKEQQGILAQAEITGSAGAPRNGRWKIRVPIDQFDSFMEEVVKLGVPRKNSRDSRDVTEEYYDLEARIKNKKLEEGRLQKHLEQSTGKLEDILAVERELTRVRGEVEQAEGRLRMLSNLTTLTTITVTIEEIKDYVPPQTPTFASNIVSTFSDSVAALQEFGKGLVLLIVGLGPWIPVIAAVVIPLRLLVRRVLGRTTAKTPRTDTGH